MTTTEMPRRRLVRLLRRRWWVPATAAALAGITAGAFAIAAGGNTTPADADVPEPERAVLRVNLVTHNGLVGLNHDDFVCVFSEVEYVLRDQTGAIVDTDRITNDDGLGVKGADWAATGTISSTDPYECVLRWSMTPDVREHYQLTVTANEALGEHRTVEEIFSAEDANPLVIQF